MVTQLFKTRTTVVWTVLILATIVSWQVGTHGGSPEVATSVVLAIAFLKVRFVGLWFMELRHAPLVLRVAFELYVVIVGTTVITMYLTS